MLLAYVEVYEPSREQETFIEFVLSVFLSYVWNKQDILCLHGIKYFLFLSMKKSENINEMPRMIFH